MRISDWSSDVCSSDLSISVGSPARTHNGPLPVDIAAINRQITHVAAGTEDTDAVNLVQLNAVADGAAETGKYFQASRSEEHPVGKDCVRTCRSRWVPYH